MLAACWARHDFKLADYLLAQEETFNLPQVLGALNLLDAGRKVRAINKRIEKLSTKVRLGRLGLGVKLSMSQGGAKPKTITKLKGNINDLNKEAHIGSLSGALAKKIRKYVIYCSGVHETNVKISVVRWVKTIPAEKLTFYALNLPKGPWKELVSL